MSVNHQWEAGKEGGGYALEELAHDGLPNGQTHDLGELLRDLGQEGVDPN